MRLHRNNNRPPTAHSEGNWGSINDPRPSGWDESLQPRLMDWICLLQCSNDPVRPGCDHLPIAVIAKRLFNHVLHRKFFQPVDFFQIDVAMKDGDISWLNAVGDWFQVGGNQHTFHQLQWISFPEGPLENIQTGRSARDRSLSFKNASASFCHLPM